MSSVPLRIDSELVNQARTTGALFDVTPPLHEFSTLSAFAEDQISLGEAWTLLLGCDAWSSSVCLRFGLG